LEAANERVSKGTTVKPAVIGSDDPFLTQSTADGTVTVEVASVTLTLRAGRSV